MYLETYVQYWRINLLTMLEYRANFLMWFGFTIVYHATAIIALWVTLHTFPSLNGWDFRQTAFMYGLWMLGHGLHNTIFFTVGSVPEFVREGRFDRFLIRPLDPLFQAPDPAFVAGASVTFEPGARTVWHTHPLGQTLIVTAGFGWVQREGAPVEEIRPGDIVWFSPGEKHWHGATPTTAMTHLAVTEALDGRAVEWMEKVTDEQYLAQQP